MMKVASLALLLLHVRNVYSQDTCSGERLNFAAPDAGSCQNWECQRTETKVYPDDFAILNEVANYQCPSSGKRVIISNGIPDHDVVLWNNFDACVIPWAVEIPLYPEVATSQTEIPVRGMIAMALNGVPSYGAQESDSLNAVEGDAADAKSANFWYGHTGADSNWHIHAPYMGYETADSTTHLGYVMDGFPIYGPMAEASELDECNGRYVNGYYQYHVRDLDQVDGDADYCNGSNPNNNWNYILGCYSGTIGTAVDSNTYVLDDDCFLDETPAIGGTTPAPTTATACADSTTLAYDDNSNKDCAWVGTKPNRRCSNEWNGFLLSDYCPVSCSTCDSVTPAPSSGGGSTPPPTPGPTPSPTTAPPTVSAPTTSAGCVTGDAWTDDSGTTCVWYETNEDPGCPVWSWYPGANGLTAGEACCHCSETTAPGTCSTGDAWLDDLGFGCTWYEDNEDPGCPVWSWYPGENDLTAGEACCHCSETCSTGDAWTDDSGTTCTWYETNEEPGCPVWSWYPGENGLTAGEACCHCGAN
jgi:hypothetical protein